MDGGMREQLAKTFVAAVASRDPATWAALFTDDARYSFPDAPSWPRSVGGSTDRRTAHPRCRVACATFAVRMGADLTGAPEVRLARAPSMTRASCPALRGSTDPSRVARRLDGVHVPYVS
jgi:hypothetical protein